MNILCGKLGTHTEGKISCNNTLNYKKLNANEDKKGWPEVDFVKANCSQICFLKDGNYDGVEIPLFIFLIAFCELCLSPSFPGLSTCNLALLSAVTQGATSSQTLLGEGAHVTWGNLCGCFVCMILFSNKTDLWCSNSVPTKYAAKIDIFKIFFELPPGKKYLE